MEKCPAQVRIPALSEVSGLLEEPLAPCGWHFDRIGAAVGMVASLAPGWVLPPR